VTIAAFAAFNSRSDNKNLLAESSAMQPAERAVKSSTEFDMLLNQRERITRPSSGWATRRASAHPHPEQVGEIIYSSDTAEIGTTVTRRPRPARCAIRRTSRSSVSTSPSARASTACTRFGAHARHHQPHLHTRTCSQAACHAHPASQKVLGVLDVILPLAEVDKAIRQGEVEVVMLAVGAFLTLIIVIGLLVRRWVPCPCGGWWRPRATSPAAT